MTYQELLQKINEFNPTFPITHTTIARNLLTRTDTIKKWDKENKVPDVWLENIENWFKDWKAWNDYDPKKKN